MQPQNRGTPQKKKHVLIDNPASCSNDVVTEDVVTEADSEETVPGKRPVGNKKVKRMHTDIGQVNSNQGKLADAANALATASLRKADEIRRATDLQLFAIPTEGMDEESKRYILWQRRQVIQQSGMTDQ